MSRYRLTNGCDRYKFGIKTKEGRGSVHYELIWEIPVDVYKVDKEFGLVPVETADFSSMIKEWKDANCESFWSNSPGPVFGALWKQAMAMGNRPRDAFATRAKDNYS